MLQTKTRHRAGLRLLNFKGLFSKRILRLERGNTTNTLALDVCAADGLKRLRATKPW